MPSSPDYLCHVAKLLAESCESSHAPRPKDQEIKPFFKTIESERIRLDRLDWQGHSIKALLYHLPNLKPSPRQTLSQYLTSRWAAYMSGDETPEPQSAVDRIDNLPDSSMIDASSVDNGAPVNALANAPTHAVFSGLATPTRDWFDRFTDWVAAVVSLFS